MPKPLASYPPEFFPAWELALAGTLKLSFPSRGKAVNFRARLYSFRKALSAEQPAQAAEFYKVDLEIQADTATNEWVLKPGRSDWKAQLDAQLQSNVKLPLEPTNEPLPAPKGAALPSLDETLSNLGFSSK